MNRRIITYAVDQEGLVLSRVEDEIAFPVLEYEKIGEGGDFTQPFTYHLEKDTVFGFPQSFWQSLRWTRKIPVALKNKHRAFWGMPLLPE